MKKIWMTIAVMALCATAALYAQESTARAKIQQRIAYMKEHVQMSSAEAQNFWKVYEEYLVAEMKAMDAYRKNLEKQGIKLGAPGTNKEIIEQLSDKQLTYLQDQKFELRKTLLTLETTYYKKYKTILTPRHLQDLFNAEYKYKREVIAKKKEGKKEESTAPVNTGKKKR